MGFVNICVGKLFSETFYEKLKKLLTILTIFLISHKMFSKIDD